MEVERARAKERERERERVTGSWLYCGWLPQTMTVQNLDLLGYTVLIIVFIHIDTIVQ